MGNLPPDGASNCSVNQDGTGHTGAVMLALSTFRLSKKAVQLAIEKAEKGKDLLLVYVVDVNLARYFIGTDIGLYPELKERCEEELLEEYKEKGREIVSSIAKKAEALGIAVRTYVSVGRFAFECLKVIGKEKPEVIVTTRSERPAWVRRFFGSPVDYLIANAGCPVIEA
ncbi:MAG: hypothetical protein AMS15_03610 [Planctomycetes bacterium DG_23]|nr:MAG: hypothetical protein AMS15_03610 [Planctomycetes bacterium DG_23]